VVWFSLPYALKNLKVLLSLSQDVYQNLALEEYLLTESTENYLLFYINSNAVVIGKHQNPWKEVNLQKTSTFNFNEHYKVARRLSGGGTVYHDEGNMNFSFLLSKEKDFVNFKEHIVPISKALRDVGIENHITERNDIFISDFKISGNAEHVNRTKNRILHHGTLLYKSSLTELNFSIRPANDFGIKTHAVSSVRSTVKNIVDFKNLGTVREALDVLLQKLKFYLDIRTVEEIKPHDIAEVNQLVESKYASPEWIYARTPQFKLIRNNHEITVRNGRIKHISGPHQTTYSWLVGLPISRLIAEEPFCELNKSNQAILEEFIL
jgi:lipoate-protein ligase A